MADPLSIAGSVVGITAAGVQASVKLYALAEKVATASQRVTSIADDISSTCAILNQVRELIIPQPDAQGTLKSVFNSVALNDISHALRRCRSSFTEIEVLLRRAFEQMGKRPALRSKIELSRFEKAKWPFLQPQFDELRSDLRDAKGNLVLMIAVASLALAQRDGRQRPIHDTERLEFTSTIVQLQRARPILSHDHQTSSKSQKQLQDISKPAVEDKGIKSSKMIGPEPSRSIPRSSVPQQGRERTTNINQLASQPVTLSVSPHEDSNLGLSPGQSTPTLEDTSRQSVDSVASEGQVVADESSPRTQTTGNAKVLPSREQKDLDMIRMVSTSKLNTPFKTAPQMQYPPQYQPPPPPPPPPPHSLPTPPHRLPPKIPLPNRLSNAPPTSSMPWLPPVSATTHPERPSCYAGWTTNHLQGLTTGYGPAFSLDPMDLPDKSFDKLIKTYTDEGHDTHIAMLELTTEQQALIKTTFPPRHTVELVYVSVQHTTTVSSVFGMLNVETLRWIIVSKTPVFPLSGYRAQPHSIPGPMAGPPSAPAMPRQHRPARQGPRPAQHQMQPQRQMPPPLHIPLPQSQSSDGEHHTEEATSLDRDHVPRYTTVDKLRRDVYDKSSDSDTESDAVIDPSGPPPPHGRRLAGLSYQQQGYDPGSRRDYPPTTAEEDGEDIVNELLARWTTS